MKGHRRLLLLTLGSAVLGLLLALHWPREREPVYEGKPLSQWLIEYDTSRRVDAGARYHARNAVNHIGTNALPFLVKWLGSEWPQWREKLLSKLPFPPPWLGGEVLQRVIAGPTLIHAVQAPAGFEILREQAAPAVPALAAIIARPASGDTTALALRALMFIGNEGLAPLVAVVTNRAAPTWVRQSAAYRIGTPVMQLGTNAVWAVTPLVGCLPDSNVSPAVAATLGRLELQPEIAVPALVKCLRAQDLATQSQAAWALGCFGAAAASAIHELRSASESRDLEVRKAATNALRQITTKLEAQGH